MLIKARFQKSNMIEITFLGTAGMVPTKERNLFSIHLKFLNNRMLFDCGENTQKQLILAKLSPYKIQNIFFTHLHADHVLGLGGLLQTLNAMGKEEGLNIYGPKGIKDIVKFFTNWAGHFVCGFPVKTHEIKEGVIFENMDYRITAFPVKHHIPCYGFVFDEKVGVNLNMKKLKKLGITEGKICREFKEKGKIKWKGKIIKLEDYSKPRRKATKISIAVDTIPCENIVKYSKNADLLICEAMHLDELKEKTHEYMHMTAKDAARLAKEARVNRLVLSHFSARYEDEKAIEKEAKSIFRNTITAKDLMRIEL